MSTISVTRRQQILEELRSAECQCGTVKVPGRTFCKGCYYLLPARLRSALYKRWGSGYVEAHEEARAFLGRQDLERRGYKL